MGIKSKLLPIFLGLLLIFLQYHLWFQDGGMIDFLQAKKKLQTEEALNAKLQLRNEELLNQIQALQTNSDAIESRARHELGMIKKGETFYQVIE